MARKATVPLELKKLYFYKGDWEELTSILAARNITPSAFIRELVHRKLATIRALAVDTHSQVELPDDGLAELVSSADLDPTHGDLTQDPE